MDMTVRLAMYRSFYPWYSDDELIMKVKIDELLTADCRDDITVNISSGKVQILGTSTDEVEENPKLKGLLDSLDPETAAAIRANSAPCTPTNVYDLADPELFEKIQRDYQTDPEVSEEFVS